jgi:hypothetical protein
MREGTLFAAVLQRRSQPLEFAGRGHDAKCPAKHCTLKGYLGHMPAPQVNTGTAVAVSGQNPGSAWMAVSWMEVGWLWDKVLLRQVSMSR